MPPMDVFKAHAADLGYTPSPLPTPNSTRPLQTGVARDGAAVFRFDLLSFRDVIKE